MRKERPATVRARWLCCLGIAAVCSARATSFDYIDSSSLQSALHPGHVLLDAGGAWVAGNAVARFRSDGSLAFASPINLFGGDALLAETSDGGLMLAPIPILNTPFLLPCSLSKLSANGAAQWTQDLGSGGYCAWLDVDGNDSIWGETVSYGGAGASLFRLDSDGSGLTQIPLPADFVAAATPVLTQANEIYVAGYGRPTLSNAAVIKIDATGNVVWYWQSAGDALQLTTLGIDAAGNVHAAGFIQGATGQKLGAVSLSAAGALRWDHAYDAPGLLSDGGLAVGTDGTAYALSRIGDTNTSTLEKIADDGTLVWTRELPLHGGMTFNYSTPDGHAGVRVAPNGDVLALVDDAVYTAPDTTTELLRYDGAGNLISTAVVTGAADASAVGVASMTALADSSVLLTTYSDYHGTDIASVASPASNGVFLHLDRAGQNIAAPFAAAGVANNGIVLDADIETDGTTYLLTQHLLEPYHDLPNDVVVAQSARYALAKIAPDGHLVWKTYWDGYWYTARVVAGADRVCIGGGRGDFALYSFGGTGAPPDGAGPASLVECHSTATGATLFSTELMPPEGLSAHFVFARLLADGSQFAAFVDNAGTGRTALLDAAGHVTQSHALDNAGQVYGIANDGSSLFINGANATATVLQVDGSTRYQQNLAASLPGFFSAQYLDDGSGEFIGRNSDGSISMLMLSPTGSLKWKTTAFDAATGASSILFAATDDAAAAYLAIATGLDTHVVKLSHDSGVIAWSKSVTQTGNSLALAVDPVNDSLVALSAHAHKLGFQAFDRGSGAVGALAYRVCGNVDCAKAMVIGEKFGADGALRVVLGAPATGASPAQPAQLLADDTLAQNPAAIAVAQDGIAGAWFAPYESGQGFVIDYIAANNVLFIPWFTFAPDGGNDPSGLAWFTLQGSPVSNANTADLAIVANSGGVFASGNTAPHQVGTAHLSFSDCDHGTLSYQFSPGSFAVPPGLISITRLGPSTTACILGDGTQRAAENTNAPSNGFDARQSGSWFDASASGQGIEFTIVPPASGSAGLFYGAWFTYDLAGTADDAANQHWFTLQGDFANATNGQVSVAIAATIGGTFDNAPTGNTSRIGQARVTFSGCSSATLDYQFDDVPIAHAYRNRSGTIALTKIGGCTD